MRNPFSRVQDEETGIMDEACGMVELSRTQRFYGFGICFAAGFLTSIMSTLALGTGNVTGFAIIYTFGNVLSLLSTGFLIGFKRQVKAMFDKVRIAATIIYLASMIFTLVAAFTVRSVVLVILLAVIQFLALFWYSASYIPFARDMIKRCCGSFVRT
ncbi:SFT2 domain-containing protein [Paraphysoderma sedebokerense]|nr:SFT2 domain-containing protein [Paraphysoderma sedebokerense]